MAIVLRASGELLDLNACLTWIPPTMLETSWSVGSRRFGRAPEQTAGFNLLLSGEAGPRAVEEAHDRLVALAPHLRALTTTNVHVSVDIALEVGGTAPQSLRLGGPFLQILADIGVVLSVTCYPCSDDEHD